MIYSNEGDFTKATDDLEIFNKQLLPALALSQTLFDYVIWFFRWLLYYKSIKLSINVWLWPITMTIYRFLNRVLDIEIFREWPFISWRWIRRIGDYSFVQSRTETGWNKRLKSTQLFEKSKFYGLHLKGCYCSTR